MNELTIRKGPCELDLLSLGALVHRLDPGGVPFRKARSLEVHVSGGEYNVAANLSDCFGLESRPLDCKPDYHWLTRLGGLAQPPKKLCDASG